MLPAFLTNCRKSAIRNAVLRDKILEPIHASTMFAKKTTPLSEFLPKV